MRGYEHPTLIVDSWSSECSECGKSCDLSSTTHDVILGYGSKNGSPGCGVRWTHVVSNYGQDLSDLRPDLIQIGFIRGRGEVAS